MNKRDLRIKYKKIRSSIENTSILGEGMFSLLINSDMYKVADTVFAYWSVEDEADTRRIINRALSDNKRVALPKCIDKNGNMKFYYIASADDLSIGMYGIMEPCGEDEATAYGNCAICLVPGLSFDRYGYRLGYGKGYYDRFLKEFGGISIGLCYNACLSELLPKDEYDIKVDYIITDTKIYDLR